MVAETENWQEILKCCNFQMLKVSVLHILDSVSKNREEAEGRGYGTFINTPMSNNPRLCLFVHPSCFHVPLLSLSSCACPLMLFLCEVESDVRKKGTCSSIYSSVLLCLQFTALLSAAVSLLSLSVPAPILTLYHPHISSCPLPPCPPYCTASPSVPPLSLPDGPHEPSVVKLTLR